MNKVDLIGRVATKIEVKESKNKKKYVRFRIAVNSFNGREVRYYTNIQTSNINLLNKAKEKEIS